MTVHGRIKHLLETVTEGLLSQSVFFYVRCDCIFIDRTYIPDIQFRVGSFELGIYWKISLQKKGEYDDITNAF